MKRLGLRTKLIVTFTGLFLAFTSVFAWYLIYRQGTIATQALETRAKGLSGILAKLIAPAVDLDLDKSQAENSLTAIQGQVADRTDLLALNAALEGTKAGEAGRGFTLVAAEMRRLAESVMESVAGIRRLMNDIRAASHSAVAAGQEGIALSEETTRSARDIALVTQQQRKATEQVGRSMDNMAATVSEATASTRQTASTAQDLVSAALRLDRLVGSRSVLAQTQREPAGRGPSPTNNGGARAPRLE